MAKLKKRPRDISQLAKLIVGISTGQVEDKEDSAESPKKKTSTKKNSR